MQFRSIAGAGWAAIRIRPPILALPVQRLASPSKKRPNEDPRLSGMAITDQSVLKVQGLSKRYGGVQALDNVGFELRPAEIHG